MLQRKCSTCSSKGGACAGCRDDDDGRHSLQRSSRAGVQPSVETDPALVFSTLDSDGQALDAATCADFDARFGHDFSRVRIHHDARAAQAADAVQARAFTVGNDIVFARGAYAPGTAEGRRLLAHELVHTIQQESAGPVPAASLTVSQPGDSLEREADRVADAVVESPPPARGVPPPHPAGRVRALAVSPSRALLQRQLAGAAPNHCGRHFKDAAYAQVKDQPGGKAQRAIFTKIPTTSDSGQRGPELEVGTPLIVGQLSPNGIWRAVCYQPTFRTGGWEIGWIPNYYVEYTKEKEPKPEKEEQPEDATRRKEKARKNFRHGLKKLIEHERKVAAGGKPLEGSRPTGAESMKAFSNSIRTFQTTLGMAPFNSIEDLLAWVDEAIAWAEEDRGGALSRRFRIYREAIVEEYEAQQLEALIGDAKKAEEELDAALAAIRNQAWIDELTKLPPALDPKKSRYAAAARMAAPVTVPLWTALVLASDIMTDFIPIIGQAKGAWEAFSGKSISGQYLLQLQNPAADPDKLPPDLETWERALAALPAACDAASALVKGGKAAAVPLVRIARATGKSIPDVVRLTTRLATLRREVGSLTEAVKKLGQAIDLRWATRNLDLAADIAKNLAADHVAALRKLFQRLGSAAVETFKSLSQAMKAALLGCRSKCKVNLALLEKQLAAAAKAKGAVDDLLKKFPDLLKQLKDQKAIRESMEVLLGSGSLAADDLAKIIVNARGKGVARILGYMEKARNVKNASKVFADLAVGGNKFKGAEWVLRWIDKTGKWGDLKAFELAGDKRFWDALIGTKLHQFKSWGTFRPGTFVEQFTKDLAQKAPRDIVWVFEQTAGIADAAVARRLMAAAISSSTLTGKAKAELLRGLKEIAVLVSR